MFRASGLFLSKGEPLSAILEATARAHTFHGDKPMPGAGAVQGLNRELATRINEEARTNPDSQYANKFVGMANGQIVVVADTLDEVSRRLRQTEPDPSKCFIVEASRDYSIVEEIWELR
jgi:hypothetical protein